MSESPFIVTVTAENFAHEVLEASQQVPVLTDFWADWCAPCQMLMPVLAKLADEYAGKFILAKINSDEQQDLSAQYGVRSLPTLKLFRHGEEADEMMGAQPESALRDWLDGYIERPGDSLRAQAQALSLAGEHEQALQCMQQLKQEDSSYPHWDEEYAQLLIQAGEYEQAELILKALPANVQAEPAIQQSLARLGFAKILEQAPDARALETTLATDADDLNARYQLSAHQVLQENYTDALENLFFIMRKDRSFNEDAGRKGLVAIFELLGHDPLVSRYRSKMSSLLH